MRQYNICERFFSYTFPYCLLKLIIEMARLFAMSIDLYDEILNIKNSCLKAKSMIKS